MAASVAVLPVSFAIHTVIEHRVIKERRDPYIQAQASGLTDAIVLIGGRVGTARSMGPRDLTRNGIEHTGRVLYGLDLGEDNCRLLREYPDRRLYGYVWHTADRRGVLTPISCADVDR